MPALDLLIISQDPYHRDILVRASRLASKDEARLQFKEGQDIIAAIVDAIKEHGFHSVLDMAQVDPSKRASAAQMLIKLYHGHGLTTPLAQVKKIRVLDCLIAQSSKRRQKQERCKDGSRISKRPCIAKAPKHTTKIVGRLSASQKISEMFNALR